MLATLRGPAIRVAASPGLSLELARRSMGLGFTTYSARRLFVFGSRADDTPAATQRIVGMAAGLAGAGDGFVVAAGAQLIRLGRDVPDATGRTTFGERATWSTGAIGAHDVAWLTSAAMPLVVATDRNCLAAPDGAGSVVPVWRPPFLPTVDPAVDRDRCHLNGVALDGDRVRAVTCFALAVAPAGWRDAPDDAGVVLDGESGEVVLGGLRSPHSPRWHGGRLWLVESGSGWLGYVDGARFERVAFVGGFGRGLSFLDRHTAIVAISYPWRSQPRISALLEELDRRGRSGGAGIAVVDLRRGQVTHRVGVSSPTGEVFDVVPLADAPDPTLAALSLS